MYRLYDGHNDHEMAGRCSWALANLFLRFGAFGDAAMLYRKAHQALAGMAGGLETHGGSIMADIGLEGICRL